MEPWAAKSKRSEINSAAIESPGGLDLNPAPEQAVRGSRRAGIAVLSAIALILGRLVGRYNSVVGYGQDGVQVIWNRIILPDASSINLEGMTGQDAQGHSGLRHMIDNHYKRLIGFAALTSLFSAGFQLSQSRHGSILQYPSPAEVAGTAVGQQVAQLGTEVTRRNLNIQPTIKARRATSSMFASTATFCWVVTRKAVRVAAECWRFDGRTYGRSGIHHAIPRADEKGPGV